MPTYRFTPQQEAEGQIPAIASLLISKKEDPAPIPLPVPATLLGCLNGDSHHACNCACGICEKCERPDSDVSQCDRKHGIHKKAGRPRKSNGAGASPKPAVAVQKRTSPRTAAMQQSYVFDEESADGDDSAEHLLIGKLKRALNEKLATMVGSTKFVRVHKHSLETLATTKGLKEYLSLYGLLQSVTLDVLTGGDNAVKQHILEVATGAPRAPLTRSSRISATQIKAACDFVEAQCAFGMSGRKHRNVLTGQLSNYLHRSHSLRWLWEQYQKSKDADGLIDGEKSLGRGKLKRIVRAITKMMQIKAG